MANISQLAETLRKYADLIGDIPQKVDKVPFQKGEPKLKMLIDLQRGYETTARISEILERLVAHKHGEDGALESNILERLKFLTIKIQTLLEDMSMDELKVLAYFLPYGLESESKYMHNLDLSRPGEKLQMLKEEKNFFEVLDKINDALRVSFLRGSLALACYPEMDIAETVVERVKP